MTEHCDTCVHRHERIGSEDFRVCDRLAISTECQRNRLVSVGGWRWPSEPLLVPADFGCIYHEARPEKKCGNCAHHTRHPDDHEPGWRFCHAQTIMGVKNVITTDRHTCDQWKEKLG